MGVVLQHLLRDVTGDVPDGVVTRAEPQRGQQRTLVDREWGRGGGHASPLLRLPRIAPRWAGVQLEI